MCLSMDMQEKKKKKVGNSWTIILKAVKNAGFKKKIYIINLRKRTTLSQGKSVISFDEQSSNGFLFNLVATYKATFFLTKYD